jgi:hypothetical protein
MAVAIMQPYFFPYLGYFQLVHAVDHFVFYDDVMYIKKGWINRNRILMQGNEFLFTIPLEKQSQNKSIRESTVSWGKEFPNKFMIQLDSAYKKAPNYREVRDLVEGVLHLKFESLADLASESIQATWAYLGLKKNFYQSSVLGISTDLGRAERLLEITKFLGESSYINAVNGQELYEKGFFKENGIDLYFLKPNLRPYLQGNTKEFVNGLSMIDVLMWNSKDEVARWLVDFELV